METWQGIVLGLIQGLTEFLPVSSSGHLVLFESWLGMDSEGGATVEAVLHLGTLLAVFWYFRQELVELSTVLAEPRRALRPVADDVLGCRFRFLWIATGITGCLGFALSDTVESLFESTRAVGIALLVTTGLLLASRCVRQITEAQPLRISQAILVGLAQTLAIVPGVSRSGTTIVAALAVGLTAKQAGPVSFLLAIPLILAATTLELCKHPLASGQLLAVTLGTIAAAVSGYFALRLTLHLLVGRRFHWFAIYTAVIALIALLTAEE